MKNRPLALVIAAIGLVVSVVLVPLVPANAAACTNPKFVTSDPNGMYFSGRYVVHNNMWNIDGYDVSETLSACSPSNWYVRATANNSSGDGAVKTYPNVHQDFHNWSTGAEPRLSTFTTIRSSFAARTPGFGIYNAAYDIWLNGVPGDHEVMIWTDNYKQVPSGSLIAKGQKFAGHQWKVYATDDNGYLAFVPNKRLTRETLPLRKMLSWLVSRGRVPGDATLGQICFGFEIVSTDGRPATFTVTDFSLKIRRS